MVSFKIPILETWVRFPGSAWFGCFLRKKNFTFMKQKWGTPQGAPGFEPGTSRSAVECSTTELHPLTWPQNYLNYFPIPNSIQVAKILIREHPDLNWGPIDLQSIALPLSYTPTVSLYSPELYNAQNQLFSVNFDIFHSCQKALLV